MEFFPFLAKISGQNLFKNIPQPVPFTSFPALQFEVSLPFGATSSGKLK
jgi:hypothetical protein